MYSIILSEMKYLYHEYCQKNRMQLKQSLLQNLINQHWFSLQRKKKYNK